MRAPPLTELYELLRAEGFAIGVDDHVRIGRLLACDATWTVEMLRTVVGALVVTDPGARAAFDACWKRWIGVPTGTLSGAERSDEILHDACNEAPGTERMSSASGEADRAGTKKLRAALPPQSTAIAKLAAVLALVALVVALLLRRGPDSGPSMSGAELGSAGSGDFVEPPPAPVNKPHTGTHAVQPSPGQAGLEASPLDTGIAIGSGAEASLSETDASPADLAWLIDALGASMLAILVVSSLLAARARRRFLPGPWRYVPAVPSRAAPMLPRSAIEDAAADLTWRVPEGGRELDVPRSVAATVERGGFPTPVDRRQTGAPRYLVLEDHTARAARWHAIYDEMLTGLAREGVAIERYRFVASPEHCLKPDGRSVPLGELIDHADALIVIGDGGAAVDPLDGRRASWPALLQRIPRRLWINPVPPARWSAGAHAIAETTPMEHGVARAVAALHAGVDRRARPKRPYPAVIERTPNTASAVAALRVALGRPAFHLVCAMAVSTPPMLAAARWIAEVLALELDEEDWLAVATSPWFLAEVWPDGLRDRLRSALESDAPELAATAVALAADRHAASEPSRGSLAHLAWQLEGAERSALEGERAAAKRTLRRIARTPLAGEARRVRARLGLPDRMRRARGWAFAIGTALVIAGTSYRIAAAPPSRNDAVLPSPLPVGRGSLDGDNKIMIGVLSDMSGLYADVAGPGSVIAAQMAVDEIGGSVAGMPIEIISGDHQNKPDIGSNIAREWFDTKNVDVIVDVPTSSVALAITEITRTKNKVVLVSGASTSDLTGKACSPNTVHWTYDIWALANATGREIVKNGGDTWFFLTADYAFGVALEREVSKAVEQSGGKVLGDVKHPLNASDFSSFFLQAQTSKAKIIGLANAGGDAINSIKQAAEFGIVSKGQKLASLLIFLTDINALGLETAQGLLLSESFYWDRDDKTREFAKKFAAKHKDAMPTMVQAGVYASVLHYLKAVAALRSAKDGKAVVAKMKEMPTDDPLFGSGTIDKNGRKRHAMYVYEVKKPEESKGKWDYYKLIREVPADQAFRAPADSGCELIK